MKVKEFATQLALSSPNQPIRLDCPRCKSVQIKSGTVLERTLLNRSTNCPRCRNALLVGTELAQVAALVQRILWLGTDLEIRTQKGETIKGRCTKVRTGRICIQRGTNEVTLFTDNLRRVASSFDIQLGITVQTVTHQLYATRAEQIRRRLETEARLAEEATAHKKTEARLATWTEAEAAVKAELSDPNTSSTEPFTMSLD